MGGKTLAIRLGLVALLITGGSTESTDSLRLSIGQAHAAPRCGDAVARHLESLKIGAEEIGDINVLPIKPPKGPTLGYRAWVPLKSCRGSLIINFTRHCQLMDSYTSGECRLDEIKQK
jgi:hypothetical protein